MLKKLLQIFLVIVLSFSLILPNFIVAADQSGAVVYIHEGTYVIEKTDGITAGAVYTHNKLPDYVPEGKYFMGWYNAQGVMTNKVTVNGEVHLYAKYADYIGDGVVADYTKISSKPALNGVAYVKDGIYSTAVNETGWALSGWDSQLGGAVLGKTPTGSAYAWEPAEKKANTQVAAKHNGYVISTANHPVGTVAEVGWTAYSNYILRDINGNAIVPKPNTDYAVTINYELVEEGNLTLTLCADRKYSQISAGANATAPGNYSDNYVKAGINTKELKAGEQLTHTYYLTTSEFNNSVPMLSIHCQAYSFMAQRVESAPGSDGNVYESYTVDGKTYYPYKITSAPKVVIRQVAVNEVEKGNVVVNYKSYDPNIGFSTTVVDGAPNASAPAVDTGSPTPYLWYTDERCLKIADTSVLPVNNTTYYSISYLSANQNQFENSQLYFGTTETTALKGDKTVKAYKYTPDSPNMIRVGDAKEGNTYRLSFSVMAKNITDDIGINIATALPWNAGRLNNDVNGAEYVIKKTNILNNNWYSFEYFFTADPVDTNTDTAETGLNYNTTNNRSNAVFMYLNSANDELYFTDIVLTDMGSAIMPLGASVLNNDAAESAGSQAMRFYFEYKTTNGNDIIVGEQSLKVIERGFIYKNGYLAYGETEKGGFTANSNATKTAKTSDFDKCWSYNSQTGAITFSTYIRGLNLSDLRKTQVKAYIIAEDENGNRHLIHSDSINRTIEGVKNGKPDSENSRVLVWNEEFDYYDSIHQVSTLHQEFDAMTSLDNNLTVSESEENYFVDAESGELVLRLTSDGNKNYTTPKSVTSQGLMAFKYGYLEARIKLPRELGTWATFWTQSDKSALNDFEYKGEIDIIGKGDAPYDMSIAIHKWYKTADGGYLNTAIGKHNMNKIGPFLYGMPYYSFDGKEDANDYHIYGFEWTPEFMAFYIDGELVFKVDITNETGEYDQNVPGMDCFHGYHYLCLNNWVFTEDKTWAGAENFVENLPDFAQNGVDYRVDYIRLYQSRNEYVHNY